MIDKKAILVTGGAGFIGSHLCSALVERNIPVICFDNFCDFYDPTIKRNNIYELQKSDLFTLIEADIRDKYALRNVFENNHIGMVIHLAAMAGVRPSIENPNLYVDVNVAGTMNLLNECRTSNISRIIFASSSSVYGNNKVPFKESDSVDNPVSVYAATKKAGELLCYTWHHLYDMSIVCLRFFTVYGPRQRPDLAIHKFTRLISMDTPIEVYGNGESSRDYTYIDDIIYGILQAIKKIYNTPYSIYQIYNLGNSNPITIHHLINTIENILGKRATIINKEMQPGDVYATSADINLAMKELNYQPVYPFEEGIKRFIDWFTLNKSL